MPTNCDFKFDRATPIYYSGEQICGHIALTTTKVMRLEAIIINCKGFAQVNWYDNAARTANIEHNDSNKDADDRIQHQGNEIYIDENLTIQERRLQLNAGQHEYKFSFNLSPLCPATCLEKYGEISYSISLMLKRRSKHDRIFAQRFVVKNRLDLNKEKYLALRIDESTENGIHLSIPRSGFVPGQQIKVALKVPHCQQTLIGMKKFRVRLCQKYSFKCEQPANGSKDLQRTLAMAKSIICASLLENYVACLRIPLLAPITSTNPEAIINVSYFLEAAILSKQKFALAKFRIPITLGTKALKGITSESDIELGEFCYDNFNVKHIKVPPHGDTAIKSALEVESPSYVDLSKRLAVYDRSPLLAKKLRRFTNSTIIRMPANICIQLYHMF